jgi:hypothetical protein
LLLKVIALGIKEPLSLIVIALVTFKLLSLLKVIVRYHCGGWSEEEKLMHLDSLIHGLFIT